MAKLLVVEDDPALRKIYSSILTKEGHAVRAASDGQDALLLANAEEPDLILLDMMMPRMSGIDFLRAYDLKGRHPKVKVIAFSNTEKMEYQTEARELGAMRYTTKFSFTPKTLAAMIQEALTPGV